MATRKLEKPKTCDLKRNNARSDKSANILNSKWQKRSKTKIVTPSSRSSSYFCHSTWSEKYPDDGIQAIHTKTPGEKGKDIFFWYSSWKINYHHSFNILSDIHLEWVFCSLASLSSLIFFDCCTFVSFPVAAKTTEK